MHGGKRWPSSQAQNMRDTWYKFRSQNRLVHFNWVAGAEASRGWSAYPTTGVIEGSWPWRSAGAAVFACSITPRPFRRFIRLN